MKRVLVTGAAKGFGREICLMLSKQGFSVVIHYLKSKDEALITKQLCEKMGGVAEIIQGDFSTEKETQAFIEDYLEKFPTTVGLVNNVGNYLTNPLSKTSNEEWRALFQTNVHAPFYLTQALIPSLVKTRGCVVNIGVTGLLTPRVSLESPAYAITKMALFQLTRSYAKEFASQGVRFNMISPGYLETAVDLKDANALPLKRAATLKEVAKWVVFLFQEENAYVTGQNIEIAGGFGL